MGSISVSGTISSAVVAAFILGTASDLSAGEDPAAVFIGAQFKKPVAVSSLSVTGDVSNLCADVLGRPYPHGTIRHGDGPGKTAWVLAAKGKHGLITAGFVVADGRIKDVAVLSDRERRGRPIRTRRYLRQFSGVGLRKNNSLDSRVDGITGATISSRAVERMAVLALRLDALSSPPLEPTAKEPKK
ncbi:MAG: FMN-binding protein [Lentisphaerae bacterium]|nr:FMN-binding protein [Lentisphaerota bacterium]